MQRRLAQQHDEWFSLNSFLSPWVNIRLPFVPYVFEPGISRELAAFGDWQALGERAARARGREKAEGAIVEREAAMRLALPASERRSQARDRVRSNRPVAELPESPAFQAYRRLLTFLGERGARVCLAAPPVSDAYLEAAFDDPDHGRAERALRDLAREHGSAYVDFRDLDLDLEVASFTNADHLTTRAGADYSARLENACFGPDQSPSTR
jgi:hypothetical protein